MRTEQICISVHHVGSIKIWQRKYDGETSGPFRCIEIEVTAEGEDTKALCLACFTRDADVVITKLGGPDDLISRIIKVKDGK